jgi:hypothetical protein
MQLINNIKNFFKKDEIINHLSKEVLHLKEKLKDQQKVINNTNAYWKRKIYNMQNRKSN